MQGYVEPLGFGISSLRSSLLTQALIRDSGAPYRIVLDTFHHYLSGVAQADFDAQIQVAQIGLVHLSGVEDGRDKGALSDEERIMLSEGDRLESRRQVQTWNAWLHRRLCLRALLFAAGQLERGGYRTGNPPEHRPAAG